MTKINIAELPLRERKKELIRHAIRESAEKLFEERGYDNVSVIEIANAANVSNGLDCNLGDHLREKAGNGGVRNDVMDPRQRRS